MKPTSNLEDKDDLFSLRDVPPAEIASFLFTSCLNHILILAELAKKRS